MHHPAPGYSDHPNLRAETFAGYPGETAARVVVFCYLEGRLPIDFVASGHRIADEFYLAVRHCGRLNRTELIKQQCLKGQLALAGFHQVQLMGFGVPRYVEFHVIQGTRAHDEALPCATIYPIPDHLGHPFGGFIPEVVGVDAHGN